MIANNQQTNDKNNFHKSFTFVKSTDIDANSPLKREK